MRQYDFGAGGFILDVYIEQDYLYPLTYWDNPMPERLTWKQTWIKTFGKD